MIRHIDMIFLKIIIIRAHIAIRPRRPRRLGRPQGASAGSSDFAKNIAGDLWKVESILGPGQDPHTHEVNVANVKLVSEADLCFQNGWNLEGHQWMEKLCRDAGKPIYDCVKGVTPRKINEDGKTINDPHAWFSINHGAKIYVKNIYNALASTDKTNETQYRRNASRYLVKLDDLDAWIRK